ncbi:TPA: AAA family ATPase [Legionella pneumophila subsp. pneumophila]|nr:AAA family ATPase [Legionella pneumophila subsp. pneumophila]HAT9105593.1 AAA family ATPase [Legionella pneumophila subsp. pneumophila]HAT9673407.1 AAA family ATPase [Legionella pneumophila subsp. pneumophila]
MSNGKTLRQLIKAGTTGDLAAFRRASETVILEERQKQHHLLANDLEQILYGDVIPPIRNGLTSIISQIPKDKEKGFPLFDIKQPQRSIEELILSPENTSIIEELLEEHRRNDVLKSYGMKASQKIILFGPPGCGKTLAAEVIAYELDYPLAVVRLDALVSSYLGETASNLRKVFDFLSQYPLVVLFDEFDAIGKERGDTSEHGELRRVVNAVLQMIDAYQGKSLILAATNHEHLLDTAIWRRFDETIDFPIPTDSLIHKILSLKLRGVRRQFELDEPELINCLSGLSGADIERVVRRAIKRIILHNQEFLTLSDIKKSIDRELRKKQL